MLELWKYVDFSDAIWKIPLPFGCFLVNKMSQQVGLFCQSLVVRLRFCCVLVIVAVLLRLPFVAF